MRPLKKSWLGVAAALLISPMSFAGISLNSLVIDMKPDAKPHTDVVVSNDDKTANAYVSVELYQVINPGQANEKRQFIKDPKAVSLLISPNKFVIPPNSRKQVRIVDIKGPGDSDRIYRALFKPIPPNKKEKVSGVRIMVAYDALILRRPKTPDYSVKAERKGNKLTFTHTGNSATRLESIFQCAKGQTLDAANCTPLKGRRLYAGNQLTLTTPVGGTVYYQLITPKKRQQYQLR